MWTSTATLLLVLSLAAPGCTRPHASTTAAAADWRLVYPPESPDAQYPKGVHLRRSAPLEEWTPGERYASEDACEIARLQKIDDAIDAARVTRGDDAKFELPVRRAVNARCVAAR